MTKSIRSFGTLLLGIYLVLQGLVILIGLHFTGLSILLGAVALVAGILLLVGR